MSWNFCNQRLICLTHLKCYIDVKPHILNFKGKSSWEFLVLKTPCWKWDGAEAYSPFFCFVLFLNTRRSLRPGLILCTVWSSAEQQVSCCGDCKAMVKKGLVSLSSLLINPGSVCPEYVAVDITFSLHFKESQERPTTEQNWTKSTFGNHFISQLPT